MTFQYLDVSQRAHGRLFPAMNNSPRGKEETLYLRVSQRVFDTMFEAGILDAIMCYYCPGMSFHKKEVFGLYEETLHEGQKRKYFRVKLSGGQWIKAKNILDFDPSQRRDRDFKW